MSAFRIPPLALSQSDSESTSSEAESSSGEDDAHSVRDQSESDSVARQERLESPYNASKDFVRRIRGPMLSTTAQQRTRMNMFGVTNTEYTQTEFTNPVLYVALYDTGDAPSETDDYHWAFIVGPSDEEANSKGTLYSMEPRQTMGYNRLHRRYTWEWRWLYNQPTVPLRGQYNLLARLMIAEVNDMSMLQQTVLRWGEIISMREHVEWMSVKWVKNVLKSLDGEKGCLGRRMESFEDVEVEGRWLAETEKEKRKGFCLLDTRVSTRTLFERERQTALSSTATVDISIKYPLLYVAVYKNYLSPYENDKYHWAFLIGPSKETAESEGVCCGVESQVDSNGLQTWGYNQTVVPLCGQDDVLVRMLVAEIVDLRPLGDILRDQDVTPTTERTDCILGNSKWNSLAWVRGKLEMLEKKPECFAYKCTDLGQCEIIGMKLAMRDDERRKKGEKPPQPRERTICLVFGWTEPDDDEPNVLVKLARGKPNTISRAVQIATGVLAAAALEMRQQVAERNKQELQDKEEAKASAGSKTCGNATVLGGRTEFRDVNKATEIAKNAEEQEAMARPERSEEGKVAKEDEKDGEESDDDDDDNEDDDEDGDEDDSDDSDDNEEDDEAEDSEDKAKETAAENVEEKKSNERPEDTRSTTVPFVVPKKVTGEKNISRKNEEHKDETENEEDEEEDEDEEDDTDNVENADDSDDDDQDEDSDEGSDEKDDEQEDAVFADSDDEDEGDEEEDDEDEEDDEEEDKEKDEDKDEEGSGLQTVVTSNTTLTLPRREK